MGIFYFPLNIIYHLIGVETDQYLYVVCVALLLIFYLIYNNKLQFRGFYTKGSKKLPHKVTWTIAFVASFLLLTPIIVKLLG